MKTLAEFKRKLEIGTIWQLQHINFNGELSNIKNSSQLRKVIFKQSNAVVFQRQLVLPDNSMIWGELKNPKSGSWFYFDGVQGKAANWQFPDENTAIFTYPSISNPSETNLDKIIFKINC